MERISAGQLLIAVAVALVVAADEGRAQNAPQAPGDTVRHDIVSVVPGPEYRMGRLGRRALGRGWRELWTLPIDSVPVLDIDRYAGGVELLRRGGGHQSMTLHFVEQDGWRRYLFRSVNKFPVMQAAPPPLQGMPAGALLQDQVSILFPAAALLVAPLLDAIGALHAPAELYIMPDDARLALYQDTFAGMLGTVELRPDEAPDDEPGFAGSRSIKSTENFLEDLAASRRHRLDEHEFLALRLIDFLINDADRTPDNYRWARFDDADGGYVWRPIARDRDRAFMHAAGWINALARRVYPKHIPWEPDFSLTGLIYTSHELDRRLLQRLTRADVEQVALRVREAIDDAVIEQVVAALPPRWRTETDAPARLRSVLAARRDALGEVALAFYADLARTVDVHGTAEAERAEISRHADGRVTVTLEDAAFYQRTFVPSETREINVYLAGGDDHAVVRGAPSAAITVRVIGGPGDDLLADSAGGGGTRFYAAAGENRLIMAPGTRVSVEPWIAPQRSGGLRLGQAWSPDWGGSTGWRPYVGTARGAGIVLGYGPSILRYGFRRLPHHWQAGATLKAGVGNRRLGVRGYADYRGENSPLALTLSARATQLGAFRFYGFGNDTPPADPELALVEQQRVAVEPAFVWHIGWRAREGLGNPVRGEASPIEGLRPLVGRLETGPVLYWSEASPQPDAPLTAVAPQDAEPLGRVGVRVALQLDRTDDSAVPRRGWTAATELAGYPPVWSLTESFSTVQGVAAAYLPVAPGGTHVAVRAGGAMAAGRAPVQHAPTIGGGGTLRGYRGERYTGDAAVHGSAELRVPVGTVPLFVRWDAGIFALADAARVWVDGRSDGAWHRGVGGGFWLSALGQSVSVAYARGEESRLYVQRGLSF
jgi:hypothetical protein